MKILVTGCAGFIGMHAAARLLAAGHAVVGVDNLNDYYDTRLKEDRLKLLGEHAGFAMQRFDLADLGALNALFAAHRFDRVLHLAAQAGVRHSLTNPHAYVSSNLAAFVNILECCRAQQTAHLVYASSSSVYGANHKQPFSTHDAIDHPVSIYAVTKRANELMAHSYSHLFALPTTGLRFFTVYGPWGRPDMSMALFTDAIISGRPINVFNHGKMRRDFTFVDDIVEGVVRLVDHTAAPDSAYDAAKPDPGTSAAPYRVFNIGNHQPVELMRFINLIEEAVGKKAKMNMLPMQPGDVPATYADIADLQAAVDFTPNTPIEVGVQKFVEWAKSYYAGRGAG